MLALGRITAALLAFLLLATLVPSASSASGASCPGADDQPTPATLARARAATRCLLNAERSTAGLPRLRANRRLDRASRRYSRRMVQRRFFDHVSPRGETVVERLRDVGYLRVGAAWSIGENLAWGASSSATPREIVREWMNSPGHRRNILRRKYRDVGIGIALGAPVAGLDLPAATYTTAFGTRR